MVGRDAAAAGVGVGVGWRGGGGAVVLWQRRRWRWRIQGLAGSASRTAARHAAWTSAVQIAALDAFALAARARWPLLGAADFGFGAGLAAVAHLEAAASTSGTCRSGAAAGGAGIGADMFGLG